MASVRRPRAPRVPRTRSGRPCPPRGTARPRLTCTQANPSPVGQDPTGHPHAPRGHVPRARCALPLLALAGLLPLLAPGCGEATGPPATDSSAGPPAAPPVARPAASIVLIVVDTLRADHLGCYGDTRGLTPSLDALAQQSLLFTNATAASSWTRSSVASIFTSRYPQTIDVFDTQDAISDELETLAETLQGAGLQTVGISTNRNAGRAHGFAQGFDLFVDDLPRVSYPDDFAMVPAQEVTAAATKFLDAADPARPFFLFLHYSDPHDPYLPHPGLMAGAEPAGTFSGSRADLRRLDSDPEPPDVADAERIRWLYAGEVKYCDLWLGRLFTELVRRDLWDETLLLVTADHGEGLWDHGVRGHGLDLYQEQIHVPLLVHFPASRGIAPGRVDACVGHVDIAPTLVAAMGLPLPAGVQGQPLERALGHPAGAGPFNRAYSEMRKSGQDLEAVRNLRGKLIRNRAFDGDKWRGRTHRVTVGESLGSISRDFFGARGRVAAILAANPQTGLPPDAPPSTPLPVGAQLTIPDRQRDPHDLLYERYDLHDDPGEQRDLARGLLPEDQPLVQALRAFAAANLANAVEGRTVPLEDLDEETLQALRGLGYVGN